MEGVDLRGHDPYQLLVLWTCAWRQGALLQWRWVAMRQKTYRLIALLYRYGTAVALEALAACIELSECGRWHTLSRLKGGL